MRNRRPLEKLNVATREMLKDRSSLSEEDVIEKLGQVLSESFGTDYKIVEIPDTLGQLAIDATITDVMAAYMPKVTISIEFTPDRLFHTVSDSPVTMQLAKVTELKGEPIHFKGGDDRIIGKRVGLVIEEVEEAGMIRHRIKEITQPRFSDRPKIITSKAGGW